MARTIAVLFGYAGPGVAALGPKLIRVGAASLRSKNGSGRFGALAAKTLLLRDPPEHTRLRRLVSRAFTPRIVETLTPRIEELAAELLAKSASGASCELMQPLAYPLPLSIHSDMHVVPACHP